MESKELLYDHYKDTINIVKDEEVKRNKLFIIMIVHILILFLITIHPQGIFKTIDGLLVENLKVSLFFSINIIQIVAMFSMLYCSIRYYQININIDRMYTYIHKIEKEVAKTINKSIEREGMGYISNYPKTLDFIYYSYKYIFPVLFMVLLSIRLIINNTWNNWIIKGLEILITFALIVLNILYMYDTKKQNKSN